MIYILMVLAGFVFVALMATIYDSIRHDKTEAKRDKIEPIDFTEL